MLILHLVPKTGTTPSVCSGQQPRGAWKTLLAHVHKLLTMPEFPSTGIIPRPKQWSRSSSPLEGAHLPFSLFPCAQVSPPATWQHGPPSAGYTTWVQLLQRSPPGDWTRLESLQRVPCCRLTGTEFLWSSPLCCPAHFCLFLIEVK